MKHDKHAQFMVAKGGAKLACELSIPDSGIVGRCINLDNQQILTIKTSSKGHP